MLVKSYVLSWYDRKSDTNKPRCRTYKGSEFDGDWYFDRIYLVTDVTML